MTPQKIARMEELLGAGKSSRDVADEIGVSHTTVQRWEAKRAKVTSTPAADAAEAVSIVQRPMPRPGDPEALTEARARAEMVQRLLERLTASVEAQTFPATSYVTLARYGDELARVIAELTPPAPKDPNADPDIIESEKTLVQRIEKMVSEAEARVKG